MKLKSILMAVLAFTMLLSLAACGSGGSKDKNGQAPGSEISMDDLQMQINDRMEQMNAVINDHADLWGPLFEQGGQGRWPESAYLETLLGQHGDQMSEDDRETLLGDIEKIRTLETEMAELAQQYSALVGGEGVVEDKSVAETFPAFAGQDLDGNAVDSGTLFSDNKVTVVNFWFSSCSFCIEEMEELNTVNEQLKELGGAVIGINTDTLGGKEDQIAEAKQILEQKGAAYQNIWFEADSGAGTFAARIYGFPTTYVVDSRGRIVGDPIMGGINDPAILDRLWAQIDQALAADTTGN